MESYEDDDDTHFCIKCNLTIQGLDNYVRHRQSGCRPPVDKNETVHEAPSTPTPVCYPEILNADAFFSSLELQSSAKSNNRQASTLFESSERSASRFRKVDRRRRHQRGHYADESGAKGKLNSMLPVADLDDPTDHLCMPSLGFSDMVTSSSGKSTSTVTQGKLTQSMTQSSSNMDGSSFPIKHESEPSLVNLMTDSKQTDRKKQQEEPQRMVSDNSAWLEDTILADLLNNEHKELVKYDFEYHQDESENGMLDDDLEDDTSYTDSDDAENRERSARDHSGGKWKPGLGDLPQDMSHMHEEDPEDDHQEHPPPTYTGGKWKPTETSHKVEYERKNTSGQPPPEHTRGKWVPGAQTDIESGYWCNPCGRKLASRLVYKRHLLSILHSKRSIREIEEDLHLIRGTKSHKKKISTRSRIITKRKVKKEMKEKNTRQGLRNRLKEFLTCEICHIRVKRSLMGKHLLSHYHCRVAGINPTTAKARRFLLDNMGNIVRQCPFQCAPCHFYCNTEDTFLLHWRSDLHVKTVEQIGGNCRCNQCDFWCADNKTMESHLLCTSHRDVVSMMNGSVPIVISCQRTLPCNSCDQQFRYNVQLRFHARNTGHETGASASDDYQQYIKCDLCPQIARSLVSLQRHQLRYHIGKNEKRGAVPSIARPAPYFCSFCSLNFTTAKEAVLHRRTSSHKEVVKACKSRKGLSKTVVRECPHCNEKQTNLLVLKEHLLDSHRELCHRCPRCGMVFALPQDVTRHTRDGNCAKSEKSHVAKAKVVKKEWNCKKCTFSTNSQAEFVFHEVLHVGTIQKKPEEPTNSSKALPKYQCPICKKIFAKTSLRNHIRHHTGEKPFPCAKCAVSFSRRSDLNAHQRVCGSSSSLGSLDKTGRRRDYICSECKIGFYTKHSLRQHMLRHTGKEYKCGLPGCPTVLRTAAELKTHRMLVHDSIEKQYRCSECSYATKTRMQLRRHKAKHDNSLIGKEIPTQICNYEGCSFKTIISSHMRRHMRFHSGVKPYKCRHCSYASSSLENLRKHVLSTSLHPGKTIYECDFCDGKAAKAFCTNFVKELRAHLSEAHIDEFPTQNHANNYIHEIFSLDPGTNASAD